LPYSGGIVAAGLRLLAYPLEWQPEIWTALATVAVAMFTLVLAIATHIQAQADPNAIELGNKDFIATHDHAEKCAVSPLWF